MTPESALIEQKRRTSAAPAESILAEVLAGVLNVDHVPVDRNFFDELGADSLMMAHFCARARKRGDLPPISIRDVYQHPTIRSLAAAIAKGAARPLQKAAPSVVEAPTPANPTEYVVAGALQALLFLAYAWVIVTAGGVAFEWITAAPDAVGVYLRLVLTGVATSVAVGGLPILAKWVLIGRWKPGHIRLWSLGYVRFWFVKTLIRSNPFLLLFVGSPLYVLYLRALGARIGRGAAIFSRRIPVCTDLLTIGAHTVIRKEAFFQCYRAHLGRIEIGAVTIGRDAVVGEKSILDIHTSMGDGSQLGHASALHSGQAVPAGERWHGSPAQRTETDFLRIAALPSSTLRQVGFTLGTLLGAFLLYLPLVEASFYLLQAAAAALVGLPDPRAAAGHIVPMQRLLLDALVISLLLTFGAVLVGLPIAIGVSRLMNAFLVPDKVYPLYGFHDRLHRMITRLTNIKFFGRLFGDTRYVVNYLSGIGYDLEPVEQTGANFGQSVTHDNPFLCSVGTGTMVADGFKVINDEVSSSSFRVSRARVGPHNFVGNDIAYPPEGRTGDNCLLGTKVMVPIDGKMREGIGLLGSPCFEIPRSVERDSRFDHLRTGDALRRGLAAKTRHNLRTIAMFLFARWLGVFLVLLIDFVAFELYGTWGNLPTAALLALGLLAGGLYYAVVDRCVTGFRALEPTICSIYDGGYWLHERLWKVTALLHLHAFDGTPFKTLIWRLMGVRMGKRVFDDGVHITERTMTTIGDECVLNNASQIQCHSLEDGTFKSDRTALGAGCTLGVGALVHYGVTMGDGSVLEADSFLMKGAEVPARARWGGNPAREL